MAGPIVRQGTIVLGVEYKAPKFDAGPLMDGMTKRQREAAGAANEAAAAAQTAAGSLELQRRAEESLAEAEERAIEVGKIVAQQRRTEAKEAKQLADMVAMEAASVAKAADTSATAAVNQEALNKANVELAESYHKAATGALTMVRGVALLAGAENESLAAALKHVFVIQGLLDVSKGAIQVQKALAAAYAAEAAAAVAAGAATNKLTASIAAMNVAVAKNAPLLILVGIIYIAAKAYEYFAGAEARAAAMAEKEQQALDELAESERLRNEQLRIAGDADLAKAAALDTLAEKEEAYRKILEKRKGLDQETSYERELADLFGSSAQAREATAEKAAAGYGQQKSAVEALIQLEKEQTDAAKDKINDQIELIKLRDRELQQAKEALKVEEDKARALRASIGALETSEQNKLKRLLEAADNGSLSRKQAIELQKLGGQAGEDIAAVFLAKMDKGLGDLAEKVRSKVTGNDPRAEAQAEFQRRQQGVNQVTGGSKATDRIRELEAEKDELAKVGQDALSDLNAMLRGLIDKIRDLEIEQNRQKQGARAAKSGGGK